MLRPGGRQVMDLYTGAGLVKVPLGQNASVTEFAIASGEAVAPRSQNGGATSAYEAFDMGGPIRRMEAEWVFQPGTNNGSVVLIAMPGSAGSVAQIVQKAVHVVFTPLNVQACYFDGGVYSLSSDPAQQIFNYVAPRPCDGVTRNYACVDIYAHHLSIVRPDGEEQYVALTGIGGRSGRTGQFQVYAWQQSDTLATIKGAAFGR